MTSLETYPNSKEYEYKVAGWLGTFTVMQSIGARNARPKEPIVTKSVMAPRIICKRFYEGEDLIDMARNAIKTSDDTLEAQPFLRIVGIMMKNCTSIDPVFEHAHQIFTEGTRPSRLTEQSSFAELDEILNELVAYYTPDEIPIELSMHLAHIRREIEFFIGLYDHRS